MSLRSCVAPGVQAGLLAGVTVAGVFFIGDLVRLEPLSTPLALSNTLSGPGGVTVDLPVVGRVLTLIVFSAQVLTVSILHFLVFGLLGVGLVALRDHAGLPLNVGTGVIYGLVVCTLVFYLSVATASGGVFAGVPGFWAVLGANAIAGAVMGSYCAAGRTA